MSSDDSPDLRLAAQAPGQLGYRDILTKNENNTDITVAAVWHLFNDIVNCTVYIASIRVQSITLHSSYPRMGGWTDGSMD
jgi:hypothetical protein